MSHRPLYVTGMWWFTGKQGVPMNVTLILFWICLLLLTQRCHSFRVTYAGCMVPKGREDSAIEQEVNILFEKKSPFRNLVEESADMTIQKCVERCWRHSFEYAGVQRGSHCFCGHTIKGLSEVRDPFCRTRCIGNSYQRCGGSIALSVYKTGYEPPPAVLLDVYDMSAGYLGCFEASHFPQACTWDNPVRHFAHTAYHVQPVYPLVSGRMTAQLCAAYCNAASHAVAILKETDKCCCRLYLQEWVRAPGKVEEGLCTKPCIGGIKPDCVGLWNGRAYVTAYDTNVVYAKRGLPKLPISDFSANKGWVNIQFPDGENFDDYDTFNVNLFRNSLMSNGGAHVHENPAPKIYPVLRKNKTIPHLAKHGFQPADVIDIVEAPSKDMQASKVFLLVMAIVGFIGILAAGFLILTDKLRGQRKPEGIFKYPNDPKWPSWKRSPWQKRLTFR